MRSRKGRALAALGLAVAGCGPPEIVPMTPPGVPYRRIAAEGMEAEGEQRNKGVIRSRTGEGGEPTKSSGGEAPAPRPDGPPG